MAGEKVFLTLDQQIDFLINDKGLIIDDHDVAINTKRAQLLKTLFHCTDLMRI